ncbi:uncharacterized protein [Montipora capricornis]|uniref:uncharacterized protein n=1 Tax=Montipora capricornis TaxID=246305 RepID=UPI0035F1BDE7
MESIEEASSTESFSPDEVKVFVKTLLMQSIALNNPEGFAMALEALGELQIGVNWSCHSGSSVFGHGDEWNTPLILAAKLGRLSMVSTLIEKGAEPCLCSHFERGKSTGRTALHEASKSGQSQIVECLLSHGSNVNASDTKGWTPIHNAICENNIDIAFKLLDNGADPRQIFSIPLPDVKNFAIIGRSSLMFSAGPDKLHLLKPSSYEWNCLSFASNCHQPELLDKLIQDYFHKDIDFRSTFGRTALHEAVILPESMNLDKQILLQKRHETLEILLKAGVNPDMQDLVGKTPLHHFFDHVNLAKVVVRKYPKIVASTVCLLHEYGADLNVVDLNGRTLVHQAAAFGDFDVMQVLLEHGACFMNSDNDGNTPAHIAAFHRNFKVLKCLLDHAPHADFKNFHGDTVLHVAIIAKLREDALMEIAQTLKSGEDSHLNFYGESEYDLAVKFKLKRLSCLLLCQMHKAHDTSSACGNECEDVECHEDENDKGDRSQLLWDANKRCHTGAKCFDQEDDHNSELNTESDFDTSGDGADVPELLIHPDTDVNAYLLKLCNECRIRGFHVDSEEDCHERCTVAKQTVSFVQNLLDLVAEEDERFACGVLCTGSAFEGYRICKPDEFDYMCEFKSLTSDSCDILETSKAGFVHIKVKDQFKEEWKMFLSEEGFLDALKIKHYLANSLYSKAKIPGLAQKTSKLSFNTTSYDSCTFCQPFVCTSKAGIKMTLFWRGSLYKFMPIGIDVTPAIHFPMWPKAAKVPPCHVLKGYADLGYHVVPKSGGGDSLLWRLSFSMAELKILQNVNPVQQACYTSLKIMQGQTRLRNSSQRFSHLGFLHTYVLKTKFFEELERCKDAEFWTEDKLTDRICSVLESTASLLNQKGSSHVESYFLPGHSIIQQADRNFGNLVAASIKTTLRNIVKLLRKEDLDQSMQTDGAKGGFSMNFDPDSNSGSDNDDSMRFVDPPVVSSDLAQSKLC